MPSGGTKTSLSAMLSATFAPSWSAFAPGLPPAPPDTQPVRRFDFPAGYNTTSTPRVYEPFGFAQLRAFANVELVRLAIETRKDQIERLDWRIKLRAGHGRAADNERIGRI